MNEAQKSVLKRIFSDYPHFILCGSAALYLAGKLNRPVGDIDILTPSDLKGVIYNDYRMPAKYEKESPPSFKVMIDQVVVDFIYNKAYSNDNFYLGGVKIRCDIEGAIRGKWGYISNPQEQDFEKHLNDLKYYYNVQ